MKIEIQELQSQLLISIHSTKSVINFNSFNEINYWFQLMQRRFTLYTFDNDDKYEIKTKVNKFDIYHENRDESNE